MLVGLYGGKGRHGNGRAGKRALRARSALDRAIVARVTTNLRSCNNLRTGFSHYTWLGPRLTTRWVAACIFCHPGARGGAPFRRGVERDAISGRVVVLCLQYHHASSGKTPLPLRTRGGARGWARTRTTGGDGSLHTAGSYETTLCCSEPAQRHRPHASTWHMTRRPCEQPA